MRNQFVNRPDFGRRIGAVATRATALESATLPIMRGPLPPTLKGNHGPIPYTSPIGRVGYASTPTLASALCDYFEIDNRNYNPTSHDDNFGNGLPVLLDLTFTNGATLTAPTIDPTEPNKPARFGLAELTNPDTIPTLGPMKAISIQFAIDKGHFTPKYTFELDGKHHLFTIPDPDNSGVPDPTRRNQCYDVYVEIVNGCPLIHIAIVDCPRSDCLKTIRLTTADPIYGFNAVIITHFTNSHGASSALGEDVVNMEYGLRSTDIIIPDADAPYLSSMTLKYLTGNGDPLSLDIPNDGKVHQTPIPNSDGLCLQARIIRDADGCFRVTVSEAPCKCNIRISLIPTTMSLPGILLRFGNQQLSKIPLSDNTVIEIPANVQELLTGIELQLPGMQNGISIPDDGQSHTVLGPVFPLKTRTYYGEHGPPGNRKIGFVIEDVSPCQFYAYDVVIMRDYDYVDDTAPIDPGRHHCPHIIISRRCIPYPVWGIAARL